MQIIGGKPVDSLSGERIDVRLPVGRPGLRLDTGLGQGGCRPRREGRARRRSMPARGAACRPSSAAAASPGSACWSRRTPTELAALESRDTGKPVRQGRADVTATMRYFEFYGGAADKIHGDTIPFLDGYTALTLREPHGVVAGIVPWNYPLQILARVVGAALAMGNTLVAKPAEDASLTAIRMAELALEAGFPDGVFNVVTGYGREAGAALAGASAGRLRHLHRLAADRHGDPAGGRRQQSRRHHGTRRQVAADRLCRCRYRQGRCRCWSTRSSRTAARPARPAAAS